MGLYDADGKPLCTGGCGRHVIAGEPNSIVEDKPGNEMMHSERRYWHAECLEKYRAACGEPLKVAPATEDQIAGFMNMSADEVMECDRQQVIWDATVLCCFETQTGIDGVENYEAFNDWLDSPAALPAIEALRSARAGVWISPDNYKDARAFWQTARKAQA
jgi:hypothetical protein